jgi:hypothetical protein
MKVKNLVQCLASAVLLFISLSSKAQLTYFENKLPCDVKIFVEDYSPPAIPGTPCSVCYSGYINLPANSGQVPYSLCANHDICITVFSVDGVTVTWYNHANWGLGCHFGGGVFFSIWHFRELYLECKFHNQWMGNTVSVLKNS